VSRRDLDEDDVRVRPSGRTRRRSKVRPDFSKALPGTVIAVDRGRFTCLAQGRMVTAVRAQHLGRKGLVVGDRVGIDGPLPESDDALVRIVTREPRRTELRRTADDTDPTERVIVANADQMVIVTSVADPEPSFGFIDRCLVAAYDAGVDPLLVLTKGDLGSPDEVLERYPGLGFQVIPTHRLPDRTLVFDGPLVESLAGSPPYSWASPGWASRRWSTRWYPKPTVRWGR
jgi:ribosome biogenesis GTPase